MGEGTRGAFSMNRLLPFFCFLLALSVSPAIADGRSGVTQWDNPAESKWLQSWICMVRQIKYDSLDELPDSVKRFYIPCGQLSWIHGVFASGNEPFRSGCLRAPSNSHLPDRKLEFCGHSGQLYIVAYKAYGGGVTHSVDAFVVADGEISHKTSMQISADISTFPQVVSAIKSNKVFDAHHSPFTGTIAPWLNSHHCTLPKKDQATGLLGFDPNSLPPAPSKNNKP